MCGIGAVLGTGWGGAQSAARTILAPVQHRGPDDEGYLVLRAPACAPERFGGEDTPRAVYEYASVSRPLAPLPRALPEDTRLALAHRRLSILDVSAAGHQPMGSRDGRRWIVFNGEIFNYIELRAELEAEGHCFDSGSDTEVILAAYAEWGVACLERFNGMFAFLLVDLDADQLFAARDRFGVKPLYYRVYDGSRVAFGSEIKQLLALDQKAPQVNGQRAYEFLTWSISDHTDETLFRNVRQLAPGHCVLLPLDGRRLETVLARGDLPVERWYELRPRAHREHDADTIDEWGALLRDAIRLRLRADVPLGSCLSGGLDSSSIVCLVHDALREVPDAPRQRVFTAVSDVQSIDERPWVDAVVRSTGVDAFTVQPDPSGLFDVLDRLTWHQDEPFGSTSIFAQWTVFALAARHGMKVMLDGQGADEQLAGYHGFFAARHAQLLRARRIGLLRSELAAGRQLHGHSRAQQYMQLANLLLPEATRHGFRVLVGRATSHPRWFNPTRLAATPSDPLRDAGALAPNVREMSFAQLTRSNLQMLLHWEDRDSMAHSIEARVPFLDYRLVEYTLGLPDHLKLSLGVTKRILRETMRGVLPETVRTRTSKLGFATPEETWMTKAAPEQFRALVRRAVERSGGVLDARTIERCNAIIGRREPFSFLPWRVISFGAWLERFDVQL